MKCVNRNHPEFLKLIKEAGLNEIEGAILIGKWQDENNTDSFPSVQDLKKPNIVWGHPALGKTFLRESRSDILDFDTDFKPEINKKYNLQEGFKALNEWRQSNQELWKEEIKTLWNKAKKQAIKENKTLVASDMIFLKEFESDLSRIITMNLDTFIDRAKQRNDYTKGETEKWKSNIDLTLSNIDQSKIEITDKYFSDVFPSKDELIKPVKKGVTNIFNENPELATIGTEAEYSNYLDSIFPESKVKDIVYRGSEKGINSNTHKWLYFTDSKNDATMYAKYNVSKGGEFHERNPIPAIQNKIEEYINNNYGEGLNETIFANSRDFIDQDSEGNYFVNYPKNWKQDIFENFSEDDIQLLENFVKLEDLYHLVKIESENDLIKQYDDLRYINNIEEYEKLRNWFSNKFGKRNITSLIGIIESALINIVNPYDGQSQEDLLDNQEAYKNRHDGAFLLDKEHFLIKNNPEQIHILGSKSDIEGFKRFKTLNITQQEYDSLSKEEKDKLNECYI